MKKLIYLLMFVALSAFVVGCTGADSGTKATPPATGAASGSSDMEDSSADSETEDEGGDTEPANEGGE